MDPYRPSNEQTVRRVTRIAVNLGMADVAVRTTSSSDSSGISDDARAVLNTRKSMKILDSYISYLDTGLGDNVVLFLHGNPTAAFLWRNIIPHVSPIARCVAPDLIGMGHSGKPDIQYKYAEHYKYLSTWIDQMNFPQKIAIVCHDWGSGLGFHWCNQNKARVHSIVHMESLVGPVLDWENSWPDSARNDFQTLRSEAGEDLALKRSFFVESWMPQNIMRTLTDAEKAEYRAPYKDNERSRLPTLTWPREIPVMEDGPEYMIDLVVDYFSWLSTDASVPKLYVHANPGMFSGKIIAGIEDWPNQQIVEVLGLHYLQEDSPHEIGRAIREFLFGLYASKT